MPYISTYALCEIHDKNCPECGHDIQPLIISCRVCRKRFVWEKHNEQFCDGTDIEKKTVRYRTAKGKLIYKP